MQLLTMAIGLIALVLLGYYMTILMRGDKQ